MIELLAPAGNKECFYTAINNGANAVYLGLEKFSARQGADNFTMENLQEVVNYAHLFNAKVYLTINTLIKNNELNDFVRVVKESYLMGVDAFILQDVLLGKVLKEMFLNIELHLSTQAGVNNIYGAMLAKENGFDRVVLARETKLEEIKEISTIIQTEVFIQGALCTSFSGNCYFSSIVGSNSGNRGLCKQPCRKKYSYTINKKVATSGYLLSLSDLSLRERVLELKKAGVFSFKIEGRMRRAEYVSASLRLYRKILTDNYKGDLKEIKRTYNRGNYTYGLAFNQTKDFIFPTIQNHMGEFVGKIKRIVGSQILTDSKEQFSCGDAFKIIRDGVEVSSCIVKSENGKNKIMFLKNAQVGDSLFITTDSKLKSILLNDKKLLKVEILADFTLSKEAKIQLKCKDVLIDFQTDFLLQEAKNSKLTEEDVINNFNKTDNYPFEITTKTQITGNIFLAKSQLNLIRRECFSLLFDQLTKVTKKEINQLAFDNFLSTTHEKKVFDRMLRGEVAVISSDFSFKIDDKITHLIFFPNDYNNSCEFEKFFENVKGSNAKKFLYCPAYLCNKDVEIIKEKSKNFNGLYGDNLSIYNLAKELQLEFFASFFCNMFNNISMENFMGDNVCLSQELSSLEIEKMIGNFFVFSCGNIPLMNLIYCPFSFDCKNCTISSCDRIELVDESSREFFVKRYKLSSCRFLIFNNSYLIDSVTKNNNKLLYLLDFKNEEKQLIIQNINDGERLKKMFPSYTNSKLIKGIK